MNCTKCGKEIPSDALFCGSCGEKVVVQAQTVNPIVSAPVAPTVAPVNQVPNTTPTVVATNKENLTIKGSGTAVASFVLSILGLVGSLIPIIGLIIGILSIIFGSTSLKSQKKGLATAGLIIGIIVCILSLVFWGINIFVGIKDGEFEYIESLNMNSFAVSAFSFILK